MPGFTTTGYISPGDYSLRQAAPLYTVVWKPGMLELSVMSLRKRRLDPCRRLSIHSKTMGAQKQKCYQMSRITMVNLRVEESFGLE